MSSFSSNLRVLAYDAAVATTRYAMTEYREEIVEYAIDASQKFSQDRGLDGLRIYTQTASIAKQFFENNNERKASIQEINPFDHYLVNPVTDIATDYVAMPAIKVTYIIVSLSLAKLAGCIDTAYGRKISDAFDDPISTQTLLSLMERVQRVSSQWGQREPSNIFLIAYPETCSIIAARSLSTFARDASMALRMPQQLRTVIDEVGDAAIEELVRPLAQDGIDYGRGLVNGSSSQTSAIVPAAASISGEAEVVPQTELKGSYLSRFSWAAASITYAAGKTVASAAYGATTTTVSLIRSSSAKAAPSEIAAAIDSNSVAVVPQQETTQSTGYWSRFKNVAGNCASGVSYCASGVGYIASGVGSLVASGVPKTVKTVAGFAAASASWTGGLLAEGAVRLICYKCKNDVSKTEQIVRQQIVKISAHTICRQAVSSTLRGMVKGAIVYGVYSATEHVIFTSMAHDSERSLDLCRNVAQTTSFCITVTGTVLWIKCLAPTAERLYRSYTPNYNPNASLFSDMAALMDKSYVSTFIGLISNKLVEKGCDNTRLGNFTRRVSGITLNNPFKADETNPN